jgi:hypothetical protein
MTDDEKALVRLDPSAAAANRTLLDALATRSAYSVSEVRDVVTTFRDVSERVGALAAWKDSGREMPDVKDEEGKQAVIKGVMAEKRRGEPGGLRRGGVA